MKGEISYDLVMDDAVPFIEGTFRLDGGPWQVIVISREYRNSGEPPMDRHTMTRCTWDSGVMGVFARVPVSMRLNKQVVEELLGHFLGVEEWIEGQGPDSMNLR